MSKQEIISTFVNSFAPLAPLVLSGLVSFTVTAFTKALTRLNGSVWLNVVNLSMSVVSGLLVASQTGDTGQLNQALTVAYTALWAYAQAKITHKIVKQGYQT